MQAPNAPNVWGEAMLLLVVLVVYVLLFALAFASALSSPPNAELANLSKKKSERMNLEVADSDFARMRGLMFRTRIVPILFVFGYEGLFPIHSHFVPAEFDAVYVSREGRVVEMFRRIAPDTDRVQPTKSASYLLELPPEMTDRLQIGVGDRLEWRKL